jgi:ABC-type transporter Mla subunit MlaD
MSIFSRSSDETRLRKDRKGMNPFTAGAIVLVIVVIAVYFGFTKHIPFTHGYRIKGVFTSAVSIRKNSPVRIAGVNVGKVTGVSRYKNSDLSVVSMELQDKALPLHKDATMKIRPRIFLEGNFFVDLRPGRPRARRSTRGRRSASPRPRPRYSSTRCSPRCSLTRARTSRTCSRSTAAR